MIIKSKGYSYFLPIPDSMETASCEEYGAQIHLSFYQDQVSQSLKPLGILYF
jgi:hypothetical protein